MQPHRNSPPAAERAGHGQEQQPIEWIQARHDQYRAAMHNTGLSRQPRQTPPSGLSSCRHAGRLCSRLVLHRDDRRPAIIQKTAAAPAPLALAPANQTAASALALSSIKGFPVERTDVNNKERQTSDADSDAKNVVPCRSISAD